ncbi:hypothetical protein [uncultured Roseovarius sp.]|uniref:hypothetical protein n=1 Tax=uncultured Roseovarius sp. TaxID=293344 RepID=UPI00260634BD|nr:hypothetical protein [uncultured Roseovarius sp.]
MAIAITRTDLSARELGVAVAKVTAALSEAEQAKPQEIWFQDEARVGQQGTLTRTWAEWGTRPRAPRDARAYLGANRLVISVFETYEDILARCCDAWNAFANDIATVRSITTREYAKAVADLQAQLEALEGVNDTLAAIGPAQ